ncbi:ubiquitin activating enzyme [Tetrahymena thermophila SB210]|uniref:Ubiquitin activating enzyme n=1 Tax=Tetrahymena thermophila (strain SB210) TaxID=312017 RepID=A0A1B9C285_TETTS|nr:ubiquitin activating enzyme [Tetrahymena thermophila SB210]
MEQYNPVIQEQELLLSRQVIDGIFTLQQQKQLQISTCLVLGLKGLGFEIVKNLYFLGVQNIYICDDSNLEPQDCSFNIYFHKFKDMANSQTRSSQCKLSMDQFQKSCQIKVCNEAEAKNSQFLIDNKIDYVIVTEFIFRNLNDLFQLNADCQAQEIRFVFTFSSIVFSFQYICFSKEQKLLQEIYQNKFNEKQNVYCIYNQTPRNFKLQKKRTFALFKFLELYSRVPQYKNENDIDKFQEILNDLQQDLEYNQIELIQNKKLKIEQKNKQMIGWSDFNLVKQDFSQFEEISLSDPYLYEKRIFGQELFLKIQQGNYLVAGCGAIGCEQAKSLLLLGVQNITLVDNDTIEISNFNRQIFYGREDNKESKAETLKKKIQQLNNQINCQSVIGYLCQENEEKLFGFDDFLNHDLIMCCFDNPQGRHYLSQTARQTFTCLIDSATHGFISQSQIQIPQYISTIQIAKETKTLLQEIPKCTLSENHKTNLEAIAWCKYFFQNEFSNKRELEEADKDLFIKSEVLNSFLGKEQRLSDIIDISQQVLTKLSCKLDQNSQKIEQIEFKQKNYLIYNTTQILFQVLGIDQSLLKFEYLFFAQNELDQIILKTQDKLNIIEFDKSDLIHLNFLYYLTCLRCELFGLEIPEPLYIIQKANDINGALITSTSQSAASGFLEYFKYMICKKQLKQLKEKPNEIENALKQIQFRLYDNFLTQNIMYSILQIKQFYCIQIHNKSQLLEDIVEQINQSSKQQSLEQINFKSSNETITIFEKNLDKDIYDQADQQVLEQLQKQKISQICESLSVPLRKNKYFELMIWTSQDQDVAKLTGILKVYK